MARGLRTVAMLMVSVLLWSWVIWSSGTVLSTSSAASSPIFFSSHGKCSMTYHDTDPDICKPSKFGNTWLPYYSSPRPGEWGIVYSFNCGVKKRLFSFIISFPLWDQAAPGNTGLAVRAKKGRGYFMETGKDLSSIQVANAQQNSSGQSNNWGSLEHITVDSPCRWVVKGVDGPESVVSQYVPAIPKRS